MEELLKMLKLDLGIDEVVEDKLLTMYIDRAVKMVMSYTRRDSTYTIDNLMYEVIDLAKLIYNRRGTEGLSSQSVSGMSESYQNEIPTYIMNTLKSHRKLV